ncbi:ABC transporter permease [Klebsiella pneumoniae]|uniref:ABC transporter permease n=1 Tax=Klebsiella pneumoniae TaxID=573 RepID=UPI0023F8B4C7|nr:ABC transporter permease [Klebsiella pneumoniae]MDF7742380.1 ABC transporter permease [Klebsiella pneumoniae]
MIARWFWREWRSPSLLIVWLALSLAVACVLALGSISDRMEKGLSQQSREFMAGDRTLRSSREVPAEWIAQARKSGLTVGEQLSFATMTFAGDTPQLADVKAVDDRYPLYGTLETQPPGLKPQAGSVLLAPRLMALLNLKTGDTIDVGDATLRIAGEVIQEPDAGFNPFQMAPRLMMNMADVAKTGAVQPGSRVAWRYKFAGDAEQLANYEQWLLPKLGPEHRWIGLDQDDSALGKSLERSQQFLLLSALLTLLLAVAAVAVAMSHYCRSRYDLVAILKTLGAGRSQLRKLIVGQWLLLLTLSVITGGVAGLALERLLLLVLKPVLPAALPAASGWPWLWAIGATGVISLLALLLVLRGDLLDRWQQQLPPQSPNYFLINIAPEQIVPVKTFLAEHQTRAAEFYPIVRARLTQINGQSTDGNKDEALNRELNLTWSEQRPDHNPLVAGSWPPKPGEVSIEEGLAQRLGIKIGDTVTFTGDTQKFGAKVSSVRKVDWESLRPNFFFIFPAGALDGQPQSWLTSFRWDNGPAMLTQLNREFPTVSLLDIGAILRQVGQVLSQVSRALEVMVGLVTACGVLLLLAQVQVGMRQRHQELVVWRTLGAGKSLLRATLWAEFALLGLVSGLVAAIGAEVALAMLQTKVFDFPWAPDWRLWVLLPLTGAVLLSLCGGGLGLRLLKGKALFRQFSQ